MKKLLFPLALGLAGCAAIPASKQELSAASEPFYRCVEQRIPSMDDGSTDAATLSRGLAGACGAELNHYRAIALRGRTGWTDPGISAQNFTNSVYDSVIPIILQYRQQRKELQL